jgi:hypothetical protein
MIASFLTGEVGRRLRRLTSWQAALVMAALASPAFG